MAANHNRYDRYFAYGEPDTGRFTGPRHFGGYDREQRRGEGGRPGVGGYRQGYPGGSGGIPVRASGRSRNQGDYWWLGGRQYDRQYAYGSYDRAYREFDEANRPRFSPIGGMHAGMSGSYLRGDPPRPLAYDRWFSDWTRWF